jgi:hypothetical protein
MGTGERVGARKIKDGWPLVAGETFTAAHWSNDMVLADDELSLRVGTAKADLIDGIVAERQRRLSLGFDYDFQDVRGVHRVGTTPEDMTGWREVIDFANALIDTGDTTTTIAIVTDTGPTNVTAPEWQAVMLQAATVRQRIWAKSFVLQAMNPIPEDYANDNYWT